MPLPPSSLAVRAYLKGTEDRRTPGPEALRKSPGVLGDQILSPSSQGAITLPLRQQPGTQIPSLEATNPWAPPTPPARTRRDRLPPDFHWGERIGWKAVTDAGGALRKTVVSSRRKSVSSRACSWRHSPAPPGEGGGSREQGPGEARGGPGSRDWNAERRGVGPGRRRVRVAAGAEGVHSSPLSGEGLAALPAALSPASRPRNYLKRCQFDSRAPLGWVLLFLCFNDSSQLLGMSCAINSLALWKAAGMKFLLHHPFGDNCLWCDVSRIDFSLFQERKGGGRERDSRTCAEATDINVWNSFRAKGDGNGSLQVCGEDIRLHGIINKFFFQRRKKPPIPSAASHLGAPFMPESPVKVAASDN